MTTRNAPYYQSEDDYEALADAQRRWAGAEGRAARWPTCPDCGSDQVYGYGLAGETELACPRCGLQYNPRDYCAECGHLLPPEDIEAGETVCLDCAGLELMAEIDPDNPLLAQVGARLKK